MQIVHALRLGATACALAGMLSLPAGTAKAQGAPAPPLDLSAFGQKMANSGIYFDGSYNNMIIGNVSGGKSTGAIDSGELAFGGVLDLNKILGIPHASLHIVFDSRSGKNVSSIYGSLFPNSNNNGPNDVVRLSELYWTQGLFNNVVDVKVGRTNPTLDFAVSDISCEFLTNVFCAQPGIWYFINNNQAYPVSTWGTRARVSGGPFYLMGGVYQNQPSQVAGQGFSWGFGGGNGLFIPVEFGYLTNFGNSQYPAKYDIGGYWDSGNFNPPGGTPSRGGGALYAQAQQTVWRPDPKTNQSATVFAGLLVTNGAFTEFDSEYYGGVYLRGPIPVRAKDTLGFVAAYIKPDKLVANPFTNEWVFELNYGINIIPGVNLKPALQYIIHPDGIGFTNVPAGGYKNAFGIGAWITINFNALTGLPVFKGN